MIDTLLVWLGLPAAAVGFALAVRQIARWLAGLWRRVDAVLDLVHRELEHNHGSSMKDDVHGIAMALGRTQRDLDAVVAALKRQHPDDPMFWRKQ